MEIANLRKEYKLAELDESSAPADPLHLFDRWFKEAAASEVPEPNAMCLSTADPSGQPHSRIVLLKGFDQKGFEFYTNYHSQKGQVLEVNNLCALTFFWPELERQVRIEGCAVKLSAGESDTYFASRPRGSQLGAWVSDQSEVIPNRAYLDKKLRETEENFEGKEVIRPLHWGGYRVAPCLLEFWQGRESRLHDRLQYSLAGDKAWKLERLSP